MVLIFNYFLVSFLILLGLRKKNLSPGSGGDEQTRGPQGPASIELFGTTDVVVKHVLEVKIIDFCLIVSLLFIGIEQNLVLLM